MHTIQDIDPMARYSKRATITFKSNVVFYKTMASNVDDTNKSSNTTTLKVAEAEQRDVGRKIARVDPDIAEALNIVSGDALELSSIGRKTTVLSWPAKESDRGKGLIRMDGFIRNRLDVGINDLVEIKVVESKIAKDITFAPTEPCE